MPICRPNISIFWSRENIFSPNTSCFCELLVADMRKKENSPVRMRELPCTCIILRQFNWCSTAVIQAPAVLFTRQDLPILWPI